MDTSFDPTRYKWDIEAQIRFLTPQEGGRRTPVFSGYRAQFYYDGKSFDVLQYYPGFEKVQLGVTVKACLAFLSPQYLSGKIHPDIEFEVREGAHIVAQGRVTKILNLESQRK